MKNLLDHIKDYLIHEFESDSYRLKHIFSVAEMAVKLANHYYIDVYKVEIAALLHDATKNDSIETIWSMAQEEFSLEELEKIPKGCLHAYSAVVLAKNNFNIQDKEILDAIKYHCHGRMGMSKVEQVIYLSDYLEETRDFVTDDFRQLAFQNLDLATARVVKETIDYLHKKKAYISEETYKMYDYYYIGGNE
ncbi:MAG: bis(5'-nucleosyl)-tetraphosphatase (symmetrical) YqeK [Candidatus Izemoplasmatales bacterium]